MQYSLKDSVALLDGVGPRYLEALQAMGIYTITDLIFWRPRKYFDGSIISTISDLTVGSYVALSVTVQHKKLQRLRGGKLPLLSVVVGDESGELLLQWFNQPYLATKLEEGSAWIVMGKVGLNQGKKTIIAPRLEKKPKIIPQYPQSKLITSSFLGKLIAASLPNVLIPELLPREIRESRGLLPLDQALKFLHTPEQMDDVEKAFETMSFVEAWQFFSTLQNVKNDDGKIGRVIAADANLLQSITTTLPFELTPGQKRVIWDSALDMEHGKVMTRLLNGDVGSGKTVVAALLACLVAKAGFQSLLIAPTEILAMQHYQSIGKLFQKAGLRVARWTGSKKDDTALSEADLVVGTHALLYGGYRAGGVGLVIIDEQHRFGVRQRSLLRDTHVVPPHVLSMTATPIPRSLALTLFAGLEVSFLKDKPKGRQTIQTAIVASAQARASMERHVLAEIEQGRQVFVVCPAITELVQENEGETLTLFSSGSASKKAVEQEVLRLRERFPGIAIEMIHGKMPAKKKDLVMQAMQEGEIKILVATTVVEVGVDIPNASILIIENAEQFGLAQLHQLRGRVGRGEHKSSCYLVSSSAGNVAQERLQVLADTDDGFLIAEADLSQRGYGDLGGLHQAGLPDFRFASLARLDQLVEVREILRDYQEKNPDYALPEELITYSGIDIKLE